MTNDLYKSQYNPDVLSCLANLSNDEVFTPPEIVNQILDMLPEELWQDKNTKFLDPACKSGVFLREIAKRLLKGLEDEIPNLEERINHIFQSQLYGIAITELTSLLSRRSVYCSKYPNSIYSVSPFDNPSGNIRFKKIRHKWQNGKCIFCGASKSQYDRDKILETHAYEMIHTTKPEDIFKMKFEVIIGNPPYQLNDGGNSASAKPIYHLFIEQAKKLNPRYLLMITPSRWFAGGKGLDRFRKTMLNDKHILKLVDYANAKECFPETSIGGGVNYFLWNRATSGECEVTNISDGKASVMKRNLNEFPLFVRYNDAINIIHKVEAISKKMVSEVVSSRNPYGFPSSARGKEKKDSDDLRLYSSQSVGYINKKYVTQGKDTIQKHKIMISKVTSEHAGEPDKSGMFKILSKTKLLYPGEICTDSYLVVYSCKIEALAINFHKYLNTKFARFLLMQAISSINLSKDKFCFVPMQDFSKSWTDKELYVKYGLTEEEIAFIESMIRPMDLGGEENGK